LPSVSALAYTPAASDRIHWYRLRTNNSKASEFWAHTNVVKRFNNTIARVYTPAQPANLHSFGGSIPDPDARVIDERETQLNMIADMSASKKAIADLMLERHENCGGHPTYVHVSADTEEHHETMIETLTADCGIKSPVTWCIIQWIRSNARGSVDIPLPKPSHRICGRLKIPRRKMIRIEIKTEGIKPELVNINSRTKAREPSLRLSTLLRAVQGSTDTEALALAKQLQKGKSLRISLGFRIARSMLYLIGSALIQSHWRADDLLISPNMDMADDTASNIQVYVDDVSKLKTDAAQLTKHFVLECGVLLWELFFLEVVEVLEEDREYNEDEQINEEESLYNALLRTYDHGTGQFLQLACLEIINNCLSAYVDLEEGIAETDIRAKIYDKIVKPLQEFTATYNDTAKPQSVLVQQYNATWEERKPTLNIRVDRIADVEPALQAARQYSYNDTASPVVDEGQLFSLDLANVLDEK
jgi:hypothetical protein